MKAKAKVSLKQYAQEHPTRGKCLICTSPFREELEAAFASGVPIPIMHRWLRDECGVQLPTESTLRHHFIRARHHEKKD